MDRKSLLTLIFAVLFCFPLAALAQQEKATITGEVNDATGAVVPKASIIVTNTETNISLKTETNNQGFYIVSSLKPGLYSITVEKAGFKKSGPHRNYAAGQSNGTR
ncbi:MAG: carboxypeptidase regulatory-like domain-containing protein [Acidobacteria bacterium]|nr:carboxypeptidase regulatory-like domain-containing protein [Acidobacteriota bacterium]